MTQGIIRKSVTFGDEAYDHAYLHRADSNFDSPERTRQQTDFLDKILGVAGNESVLDLACGIGTYSLEMASRGRRVTAFDISSTFLERVRADAESRGLSLQIVRGDYRELAFTNEFDALVLTAGLFYRSAAELVDMLRRFERALRAQGRMAISQFNPVIMAKSPRRADWWRESPDVYAMESTVFDAETSSVRFSWHRIELASSTAYECEAVNKCLPFAEFCDCIKAAGLAVDQVYSTIDLQTFDPESSRAWFLVARKQQVPARL